MRFYIKTLEKILKYSFAYILLTFYSHSTHIFAQSLMKIY